jgi:hypothetical protein
MCLPYVYQAKYMRMQYVRKHRIHKFDKILGYAKTFAGWLTMFYYIDHFSNGSFY